MALSGVLVARILCIFRRLDEKYFILTADCYAITILFQTSSCFIRLASLSICFLTSFFSF
jgi:hypothetical protein